MLCPTPGVRPLNALADARRPTPRVQRGMPRNVQRPMLDAPRRREGQAWEASIDGTEWCRLQVHFLGIPRGMPRNSTKNRLESLGMQMERQRNLSIL